MRFARARAPGVEIFRGYSHRPHECEIREALVSARVPNAGRKTLHCMQRGAVRALLAHGGTLSGVIRARGWIFATFQLYIAIGIIENFRLTA